MSTSSKEMAASTPVKKYADYYLGKNSIESPHWFFNDLTQHHSNLQASSYCRLLRYGNEFLPQY